MYIANNVLEHHLQNVYFIGGTACGGKTTMSQLIAKKYGMFYYNADDAMIEHLKIAKKEYQPAMSKQFESAEAYFNRPVQEYSKWILDINAEALDMILMDLIKLSNTQCVIVEGHFDAKLLKKFVPYHKAFFLYAESDIIKRDYFDREDKVPMLNAINKLSDSPKIINHVLDVSAKISEIQLKSAKDNQFKYMVRDFNSTIDKTLKIIENHFQLS